MKAYTYYEYTHYQGYGKDDHMADEVITRAACYLGLDGADDHLLSCVGLISHPVSAGASSVRIAAKAGVRRKMEAALNRAYTFLRERRIPNDVRIEVTCWREYPVRHRRSDGTSHLVTVCEERRGGRWQ